MRFLNILILFFIYSWAHAHLPQKEYQNNPIQNCEKHTANFVEKIAPLLQKNDFSNFDEILKTYKKNCGINELFLRIQILQHLIEKKSTQSLLHLYHEKKYEEQLIKRLKSASHPDFEKAYSQNPSRYDFLPLRHPIDQLTQIKAEALLQSSSYDLSKDEESILYLFAGDTELYSDIKQETKEAVYQEKYQDMYAYRSRYSGIVYAGMIGPIGAINPIFKLNPAFGVQLMSPIKNRFFYELGVKLQINSGARNFDYLLYDELESINSDLSIYFGGDIGFVALERKKFILTPKVGIGFKSVSTGLSETTYYDADYYYDEDDGSGITFHNVNTMDLSFSVAGMQYLHKRTHIGLQASYHFIPYNWDRHLKTEIFSHYASLDLLFRF
ncbi:MAG TPA: hypothetical protein VK102_00400 [Sphingobacterium sp.]|nr:hypothetical protein [Sphingobacterium sp.]